MSVQHRRKYDLDYKRNAVLLSQEEGRTVREVADNLGVGKDLLYRWRREYLSRAAFAFPGMVPVAARNDKCPDPHND